ncbi:hypothetical protein IQ255_25410 [Pleurocapsales cyanobacterium LEGE 10410]|nr:hypothetical protein [Pleurocapsales cyanobacterium LEGE 10410]
MSEANNHATPFNSESDNTSCPINSNSATQQNEIIEKNSESTANNGLPSNSLVDKATSSLQDNTKPNQPLTQKMDWQKVAHKLREYNRKLHKNVFRLEQQLAEIDNKFNKHIEKSRSSDLLLAQQAEEIENYQEQIATVNQQLTSQQQQIDSQEAIITKLSQQHELSQKQTAELERECTLLQEKYSNKSYELNTKEQENQELQTQLSQLQAHTLQCEAELKRYKEKAEASRKEKASSRHQNYPHNRYIQPWSTASIIEPKIALPKTKIQPAKVHRAAKTSEKTGMTAEIGNWSASTILPSKTSKSKAVKSSESKKPQSLAAVDLPTFPRPQ